MTKHGEDYFDHYEALKRQAGVPVADSHELARVLAEQATEKLPFTAWELEILTVALREYLADGTAMGRYDTPAQNHMVDLVRRLENANPRKKAA